MGEQTMMILRNSFLVSATVLLAVAATADGSVIVWNFTGTATNDRDTLGIKVGDPFFGNITFESTTPLEDTNGNVWRFRPNAQFPASFTYTIGSFTHSGYLDIIDVGAYSLVASSGEITYQGFQFRPAVPIAAGSTLPLTPPVLEGADAAHFSSTLYGWGGTIDTLTAEAVPEPSSLAIWSLIAVSLLGIMRRPWMS